MLKNHFERSRTKCFLVLLIIKGGINKIWAILFLLVPLGASWRYIPFHFNLDKSEGIFVALLLCQKNYIFQSIHVEETKSEPLGDSCCYSPFHSNLDESQQNFVALLMYIPSIYRILIIKGGKFKIWASFSPLGAIVHFIPIWTNLNKTLWHYSCSIETTYFNH